MFSVAKPFSKYIRSFGLPCRFKQLSDDIKFDTTIITLGNLKNQQTTKNRNSARREKETNKVFPINITKITNFYEILGL